MAQVVVLKDDWASGDDPVPYYATMPAKCISFSSHPQKPRIKLKWSADDNMPDCEHGVAYDVVICDVLP